MAARKKKTASKQPAARKAARKKTAAKKLPARKAAKPPARKAAKAKKKAPAPARKKVAARKATKPATRRPPPKGKATKRKVARKTAPARLPMVSPAVAALDERIALVRANLRELVEMAAGSAGAASEELMSQRITEQEEKLRELTQQRDEVARQG